MAGKEKRTGSNLEFERSAELKRLFSAQSEAWFKKTRLGMADLAQRCGVSVQYLSHIGRYGRVPSKPILTLLAFNLENQDPSVFYRAAGFDEPWPYEAGIGLRAKSATESGLLSINLDMNGFATAIREIVRSEIQPKKIGDLLGNRPLRVGINRGQFFLFEEKSGGVVDGFFPELIRALVLSLHCEVEFVDVLHSQFAQKLESGEIDCYGPIYKTAARIGHGLFSKPFCHVAIAGLGRVRKAPGLAELASPKRVMELRKREYIVAVHRESMAHHFAETELGIPSSRLIVCDVPEEAAERVVLASLPRPAHVVLTDRPFASKIHKAHSTTTELLFADSDADAPPYEDTMAIRPDWPALLAIIDESLDYLRKNGGLARLINRTLDMGKALGVSPSV